MKHLFSTCLILILTLNTTFVNAQMAVARSESFRNVPVNQTYQVRSIVVDASLNGQVADVITRQTLYNPGNRQLEVEIFFPLPAEGIVQNLTLMVDGTEIPGKLLSKEEARSIYEGIVRRKKDPALLEYVGYGLYKTSVFPIPPRGERTISIQYSQLCKSVKERVHFFYPFGTQKFSSTLVQSLKMKVRIKSDIDIKTIYSPSDNIDIVRSGNREAVVTMEKTNILPTEDFNLIYTQAEGAVGASLLSYKPKKDGDGYFMLLASPEVKERAENKISKTVVFILDRSGSMAGKKMEQARKALEFVLGNLRENDLFNIVVYDDRVESFKNELQRYNSESYKQALSYVRNISSGGGTNINDALKSGMEMIKDDTNPNYVLFLTDGLATSGITNEMRIAKNCETANRFNARLFPFGVGYDVNARLLDRLSSGNGGNSVYVRPEENLETKVAEFFSGITAPVLTNISIKFNGINVKDMYPRNIPDLFAGGQLLLVGRYPKAMKTTVTISGKVGDESKTFKFPVEFMDNDKSSEAFVEKIWATRRVGYLLEQIDLNGRSDELVKELVKVSKNYGILTPYTSFLAREDVDISLNGAELEDIADENLEELTVTTGISGNEQRNYKNSMMENAVWSNSSVSVSYAGESVQVKTMQNYGNKTFFYKNKEWVESDLEEEELKNAIEIIQFSDDYFQLSGNQSAEGNKYLAREETTVVRLSGNVYRIVCKK